jgi:hypothetical protein
VWGVYIPPGSGSSDEGEINPPTLSSLRITSPPLSDIAYQ